MKESASPVSLRSEDAMDCCFIDCNFGDITEAIASMPLRAQAHYLIDCLPVEALKEAAEDLTEMYQFYKKQEADIVSYLPE